MATFKKGEEINLGNGMKFMLADDITIEKKMTGDSTAFVYDTMNTAYQACLAAETESEYFAVVLACHAACDGKDKGYTSMMIAIAGAIVAAWMNTSGEYEAFINRRNASCKKLAQYLRTMKDGYDQLIQQVNAKFEKENASNG